jgi:hypothetical protein
MKHRALMMKDGSVYHLENVQTHVEVADHHDLDYQKVNHIGYMIDGEFSISPMYLVRPNGK